MAKGADYSDLANIKTAKQKKQEALCRQLLVRTVYQKERATA